MRAPGPLPRGLFVAGLFMALLALAAAAPPDYPPVQAGQTLEFPSDHGAHPDYRTEWWYVTGWLQTEAGVPLGFQVTFFRSRPQLDQANPSRFAPKQLLFAHAAISDPALGRLQHDQRSARVGFGLAQAAEGDTDVRIGDWSFIRGAEGAYVAKIAGREFDFELTLVPTAPLLLQGETGLSRKGPRAAQASYYYSWPHLSVSGLVVRNGKREVVRGTAWLDHEWSSEYLAQEAVGWDWIGINLDDGGALMAFRIRDKSGGKYWAGGTLRRGDGSAQYFPPKAVSFTPLRRWRSPRTGASYPVAMRAQAGETTLELEPLMDDQELDSRGSTGAVYWEGAVTARCDGKVVGRGYLELTGYLRRLDL